MKVAVMASGMGSNLAALIDATEQGRLAARIVLVVSDKADAGALGIAAKHGISSLHISAQKFPTPAAFDQALLEAMQEHGVELIALAGYLKKVRAPLIDAYRGRIVNMHPALLPAFGGKGMYGRKVHEAVLDYGCKVSGLTVHLVDNEYDTGPPVLQRCVAVKQGDTPEVLAARVLEQEHVAFAEALQYFVEGRVEVNGRQVIIK